MVQLRYIWWSLLTKCWWRGFMHLKLLGPGRQNGQENNAMTRSLWHRYFWDLKRILVAQSIMWRFHVDVQVIRNFTTITVLKIIINFSTQFTTQFYNNDIKKTAWKVGMSNSFWQYLTASTERMIRNIFHNCNEDDISHLHFLPMTILLLP